MKAIAVFPGKANSVHLADLPKPSLDAIPMAGACSSRCCVWGSTAPTARSTPPNMARLPMAMISWSSATALVRSRLGPNVTELRPGDYVVATVRRPGASIYDHIGTYDMTTDDTYYERGINLRHGYLTEYYVDDPEYIVKIPGPERSRGALGTGHRGGKGHCSGL